MRPQTLSTSRCSGIGAFILTTVILVRSPILEREILRIAGFLKNGTGYPKGLAGTEIPLCGRIVALADFYDAVTFERVYKKAYSHARACRMIRCETGFHFDSDIARVFMQHADEFNRVRTSFQKVANRTAGISKPAAKIVSTVVLGYTARAIKKKQTL